MMMRRLFNRLRQDRRGSVLVEFAILAPALIGLTLGVFEIGVQMYNYNTIRSVASDVARETVIEAQRRLEDNTIAISDTSIEELYLGRAMSWNLDVDRLTVDAVEQPMSRVPGAKEFDLRIQFEAFDFLGFMGLPPLTMSYNRPIFVVT